MEPNKLAQLHDRIILLTADAIEGPWDAATVNIEIAEIEGELKQSCECLSFRKPRGVFFRKKAQRATGFPLPGECYDLFLALREEMANPEPWTICHLEFTSDGEYKYTVSYDPPKRLTGACEDGVRLANDSPCGERTKAI